MNSLSSKILNYNPHKFVYQTTDQLTKLSSFKLILKIFMRILIFYLKIYSKDFYFYLMDSMYEKSSLIFFGDSNNLKKSNK